MILESLSFNEKITGVNNVQENIRVEAYLICPYSSLAPFVDRPKKLIEYQDLKIQVPIPPSKPYQSLGKTSSKNNNNNDNNSDSDDTEGDDNVQDPNVTLNNFANSLSQADIDSNKHHLLIRRWLKDSINEVTKLHGEKPWYDTSFVKSHVVFTSSESSSLVILGLGSTPNFWVNWEKKLHGRLIEYIRSQGIGPSTYIYLKDNSHEMPFTTLFHLPHINLQNKSIIIKTLTMEGNKYIYVPPMSGFCIADMQLFSEIGLDRFGEAIGGWNVMIFDPPWPNKSISRSNLYSSIDIYDLFKIRLPISKNTKHTLIGVWITNKPKFRRFVKDKLFPFWNVRSMSDWYWVKVTNTGKPVWDLDSKHRRCYEGIIFGYYTAPGSDPPPKLPPTVFLSTPLQHSRKPSLLVLLRKYINDNVRMLEYFARSMPGSVSTDDFIMSIGNESVAFNEFI